MAQSDGSLSASLLKHLNDIAKSECLSEYTIEHEAGSKQGDGFMSTMLAVTLIGSRQHTDGTKRPDRLSLICKMQPPNESRQEHFQSGMTFDREIQLYNEVLPAIEKFQLEKGVVASERFNAYPKVYLAQPKTATEDAIIIMQDLRTAGFVMWNKGQPLQFANAKMLFEQLGLLHGVSVAIREQQPELYAEWAKMPDIFAKMWTTPAIQAMFKSTYDRAIQLLTNPQHIDVLNAFQTEYIPINIKCMDPKVLGQFSVLGHGDCWNNNVMYGSDADWITVLDWQLTRVTSPAIDLSYFLFSSTDKSLRDQHLDELLRIYYAKFSGIIRQCGSDPEKLYTFDDLQAQLKTHGVYGVLTAPMLIAIMVAEAKDLVNIDEMSENFDNQVESQEGHLVIFDKQSEQRYVQRLSDVFDDAIKYGWLSDYVKDS